MTHGVAVTGIGLLTSRGLGLEANLNAITDTRSRTAVDYSLGSFQPAAHMADRRMLKAISSVDALGLVALEQCRKDAGLAPGMMDPWRVGLYVGSPPSACSDHDNYIESMLASAGTNGRPSELEFGVTCMQARPNTLLTGLPNNVLCYGAITLDARGPNSNYTALETSAHLALLNAAKRIWRGRLDTAFAGAYAAPTEPVGRASLDQNGWLRSGGDGGFDFVISPFAGGGTVPADGAIFTCLEETQRAVARGAKIHAHLIGGATASDAMGIGQVNTADPSLARAISNALAQAGVEAGEIGLVMLSGTGVGPVDASEMTSIETIFAAQAQRPALATASRIWGHMMEASGVAEIALVSHLSDGKDIPIALAVPQSESMSFAKGWAQERPYVLLTKVSFSGESSCLLLRRA